MARIKIKDLSRKQKVSKEGMRKIIGEPIRFNWVNRRIVYNDNLDGSICLRNYTGDGATQEKGPVVRGNNYTHQFIFAYFKNC